MEFTSLEELETDNSEDIVGKPVLNIASLISHKSLIYLLGVKPVGLGLYEYESETNLLEWLGSPVSKSIACNMLSASDKESDDSPKTSDEEKPNDHRHRRKNCLTSRKSLEYQEVIELSDDHSTFRNREVVEISDDGQRFQAMHKIRSMGGLSSTPSASDENRPWLFWEEP